MIFTIIVVGLFVFKAPALTWLSFPICFAYLAIKSAIKKNRPKRKYDEFDWWQDNQGLYPNAFH